MLLAPRRMQTCLSPSLPVQQLRGERAVHVLCAWIHVQYAFLPCQAAHRLRGEVFLTPESANASANGFGRPKNSDRACLLVEDRMPLHASTGMYSVRAAEITLRGIPVSAKHHLLQRVLTQTPPMLGGVKAAHVPTARIRGM